LKVVFHKAFWTYYWTCCLFGQLEWQPLLT
jgi:hypothetical protein